ncbi:MAG: hypothetical protein U0V64_14660 [Cyclobacteriaceae bacterium]
MSKFEKSISLALVAILRMLVNIMYTQRGKQYEAQILELIPFTRL